MADTAEGKQLLAEGAAQGQVRVAPPVAALHCIVGCGWFTQTSLPGYGLAAFTGVILSRAHVLVVW